MVAKFVSELCGNNSCFLVCAKLDEGKTYMGEARLADRGR